MERRQESIWRLTMVRFMHNRLPNQTTLRATCHHSHIATALVILSSSF